MILAFNTESLKERVQDGSKRHTCRTDKKGRWRPGTKIQFWNGSPYLVKKNPSQFGEATASEVVGIMLDFVSDSIELIPDSQSYGSGNIDTEEFARNDGFNSWAELKGYFGGDFFAGRLIFWEGYQEAHYVKKEPKPPKPPKEPKPPKRYKSWRKLQLAIPFEF